MIRTQLAGDSDAGVAAVVELITTYNKSQVRPRACQSTPQLSGQPGKWRRVARTRTGMTVRVPFWGRKGKRKRKRDRWKGEKVEPDGRLEEARVQVDNKVNW